MDKIRCLYSLLALWHKLKNYRAMRGISGQALKDGNYNVEDVMKSIMDTYEARYNEIVKEHENGDREVSYGLTGKSH